MRFRNLITRMTSSVVTWATAWTHVFQNLTVNGTLVYAGGAFSLGSLQTATIDGAGITVTPAAGTGVLLITVTTNNAFTVDVPAGTSVAGQQLVIIIVNASGGAMGAVTFAAAYMQPAAFTEPASATRKVIIGTFDGTDWNLGVVSAADLS